MPQQVFDRFQGARLGKGDGRRDLVRHLRLDRRDVAIEATSKTDDELWKASGTAFASIINTEDYREGPKAFIEKRAPVWKGK